MSVRLWWATVSFVYFGVHVDCAGNHIRESGARRLAESLVDAGCLMHLDVGSKCDVGDGVGVGGYGMSAM